MSRTLGTTTHDCYGPAVKTYLRRGILAVLLLASLLLIAACGRLIAARTRSSPPVCCGSAPRGLRPVQLPRGRHRRTRRLRRRRRQGGRRQARRQGRIRRDAVGFDLRGAGGQPLRRGRQRGHDQRRAQGQIRPVQAVFGRRGRHRHRVPTTTRSSLLPTSRARSPPRTPPATGRRSRATPAPASSPSRASPRRSNCSTRAGSTSSSTTASRSTPTSPRPATRRSRSPRRPARRASRASPPARTAACCPSSTRPSTNSSADGTLAEDLAEVPQGRRLRCARPAAEQPRPRRSTWQLILDNLVAARQGRDHRDDPADHHQLRHRPGRSRWRWRWPGCRRTSSLTNVARFYISIIRGTPAAGAVVHRVLRAAASSA